MKRILILLAGLLCIAASSCTKEETIDSVDGLCGVNYWKVTAPSTVIEEQNIYINFFYFEGTGYGTIKYVDKDSELSSKDGTLKLSSEPEVETFGFKIVENSLTIQKGSSTSYSIADVNINGEKVSIECETPALFKKKITIKKTSLEEIITQ